MAHTAIAQINVRLPRQLKESGDAGLRVLGLSPSDAVRALWQRLAQGGDQLNETKAFLRADNAEYESPNPPFEQSPLAMGWKLVDEYKSRLGITEGVGICDDASTSDAELAALALEERMKARGVM